MKRYKHAKLLENSVRGAVVISAENQSGHDIHINTDAHLHSSFFWPERVENPFPAYLPDTPNIYQRGPLAERLSDFLDLDAVKAHMHGPYKLGPKLKKVQNHQSQNATQNTKNWSRKALSRKI
jgi:hypothetical protein